MVTFEIQVYLNDGFIYTFYREWVIGTYKYFIWDMSLMKFFRSKLFGDIVEPESFVELLELMIYKTDKKISGVRLWRGQGDIDWPLHSGAYRKLMLNTDTVFEQDIVFYEKNLLLQARHRGYAKKDGVHICDVELLAKLQHHGAATRLVDFSKNSLISLWFCVQSSYNKTGLLLGVHTDYVGGGRR